MKSSWILIAAAIALPAVFLSEVPARENKTRIYAQEQGAIKTIMTLNTAQAQYYAQHHSYAATIAELAPSLASSEAQGYKYAMTRTPGGYAISATPSVFGSTGSRTFYSDQTLIVHEHAGPEPATAGSPTVGASVRHKAQAQAPAAR